MKITNKSEADLDEKIVGNSEERLTFQAMNTDSDKLFDPSLLKVKKVTWEVKEKAWELLEGLDSKEKKVLPKISIKMQKYLDAHNILEQNIPECISLINQLCEYVFSKKLETKGKKLKLEIELLLKNDNELLVLVSKLINIENHQEEINYAELTSIIVEMLDYESRLIGQYRRNKDELLERLKISSNINVWWNKNSNDIASLNKEELIEIFSCCKNAELLDISSYDLDLLDNNQLEAIFSNFNNAKTISLEGAVFTIKEDKQEIIFKNLQNCESLNYTMNSVTDEALILMKKYLKNIKSIDFTMCELTQKQKEYVNSEFLNVDICLDWLDEGIELDVEGK